MRVDDLHKGSKDALTGHLFLSDGTAIDASLPGAAIDRGASGPSLSLSDVDRIEVTTRN